MIKQKAAQDRIEQPATMSADQNILEVLGKLETRKMELEANLDQMQQKSLSLKRRKDDFGRELAAVNQDNAAKQSVLNSVRNQVDILQNQFNFQQESVHKTHEMLKYVAEQTKDLADRRFAMIGEFEEELAKIADISAKHSGNGTLGQLYWNLNVLASKEIKFDTDLEAIVDELQSLNVDQDKSLCFNSESQEMKEATAKCQKALRDVTTENDDAFIEISKLRRSLGK